MEVIDDLWFVPRMELNLLMLDHTYCCFQKNSQEDYDNTALGQTGYFRE